ncbi:patatin-like phospholipase family protein [Carboxylicivirga taeanensis]|uniref:patatin-like phospholipase family protein n=1 Tax=Carboxylicivirga taeanensis TaxID=1416875 RepID=UPI003F6DB9D5
MAETNRVKTVSLVLGSGGARGLAHIGIIRWLEEHDYTIRSISGCSIGAVIGGIYAAGQLDVFEKWIKTLKVVDIVSLMDVSWGVSGLIKGDKLMKKLGDLIGDEMIEQLPIKFTAVASDVKHEKEIWLTKGSLFDAMRASISLPLFLTPVTINDIELIDGGVLNPIPIAPVIRDKSDHIIAVNLGAKPKTHKAEKEVTEDSSEENSSPFWKFGSNDNKKEQSSMHLIADQAFNAMQNAIARHKLATYPPDSLIEIDRDACGTLDFHKADEIIKLGYQRADEALKEL